MPTYRKRVKHFHEPGDLHELTFSCYQRLPLLQDDEWKKLLSESIQRAISRYDFSLVAFVYMPEHVHLLIYPRPHEPPVDAFLKAVKRPFSYRIKQLLIEAHDPLLKRLTVRERPGVTTFRFWQEGPGYDRNLNSETSVLAAIDYIHLNPVRRGLCTQAREWIWSSARYYEDPTQPQDARLPRLEGVPWGL